ncbi:hypothetical protein FAGAP_12768 [Fusarium agapanthi]|uniref:3'-5' exonuclease domain-containing protein n=1 Tax=Fusarium agapanthi TaxID=1803897 RepID=A0A9P5E2N1_9HYPO|nr:hypothetical protein FAGAP_12768 [Fusarium agapanthi]
MESPTSDIEVINSIQGVKSLADGIAVLNASHESEVPLLYIDIEPRSLGASGELNLLTIILCHGPEYSCRLYIVDVNRLANQAFSTRGYYGASLRSILDSASYQKVFFDVCYGSYILYTQYGIKLQSVRDLQLMENASSSLKRHRPQLEPFEPLIQKLLVHGRSRKRWLVHKFNGEWLFKYGAGAPHLAFQKRPVIDNIGLYCCRNARFMPELHLKLSRVGLFGMMDMVAQESQNRVDDSQRDGYNPFANGRFRNPWTVEQNEMFDSWVEKNIVFDRWTLGKGILS